MQQGSFFLEYRLAFLEVPVDVAFTALMLFGLSEQEFFGFFLTVAHLYLELGNIKALADLRAIFPHFLVEGLSEGEGCVVEHLFVAGNADHVFSTRLEEDIGGGLAMTSS